MSAPVRLRLSRARGFDLQAHSTATNGLPAVNVARPTKWGNPFVVGRNGTREECVQLCGCVLNGYLACIGEPSMEEQGAYRRTLMADWRELEGRNLACWCALDGKPCHADLLMEAVGNLAKRAREAA